MKNLLEKNFDLARKNDSMGQKALYEMFSDKMLAIANSYTNNIYDAEDLLVTSFYTCFKKINECRDPKSFPFWLRKIVVNNCVDFIRKNKNLMYLDIDVNNINIEDEENSWEDDAYSINLEDIFSKMPDGYRLIFNLSVFEEKKHQEIAAILNISEGTSKSQLSKAKKWIID